MKKLILDSSGFIGIVKSRLAAIYRCPADVFQLQPFVVALFDEVFYGEALSTGKTPREHLMYGSGFAMMTETAANELVDYCRDIVLRQLRQGGVDLSDRTLHYEYDVLMSDSEDVILTVKDKCLPQTLDRIEAIRQEIREAEENGDYVPESMRRLAGV